MTFFQQSVLNKYLKNFEEKDVNESFTAYKQYFHNPEIQKNIRLSKEEQFQEGFLRELFVKILGYKLNPTPDYNLTTEFKNEKGAKKADGAILKEGKAIGVIELKGTDTKYLDKINAQAFEYKNNQSECIYVITSNFEKLRFFINNAVEYLEFNLFTLTDDEFKLLWLCLSAESLLEGLPLKVKEESLLAEENITKELYKDYSNFKRELWQNIVKNMPDEDQLILFKKSQKLLDRFLFIFFSEDSGLLPPNSISRIVKRWEILKEEDAYKPLYDIFKQYFGYINKGRKGKTAQDDIFAYNGGLFLQDEWLDRLVIDDEVLLRNVIKLTNYDFQSDIDVNILGHIFENSLNEIENITAELRGEEIDKKKTKRKKDGVYYTPKYITKYIVDNTVGKLCEEKKPELGIIDEEYAKGRRHRKKEIVSKLYDNLQAYREWLLQITICDPACGSGAFLNQALEFLIEEHAFIDELQAQITDSSIVFQDVSNHILENNLYGVDINEESVEIAKLSLWLRTAQRGRKLTFLNKNIKCGNSLIDDPEVAGEKAFNWKIEFPIIFENGGFDVVIGNPPWGAKVRSKEKSFIISTYVSRKGELETYVHFIDLSLNKICREAGIIGLITPNTWYYLDKYIEIRRSVLKFEMKVLIELEKRIFKDAPDIVPAITVVRKQSVIDQKIQTFKLIKGIIPSFLIDRSVFISSVVNKEDWKETENITFNLLLTKQVKLVLDKIKKNSISDISSTYNVRYGIKTGNNKAYVSKVIKHKGNWKNCIASASSIKKYELNWEGYYLNFGRHLSGYSEKPFDIPKVLIQYIRKLSLKDRLVCGLDKEGKYFPLNNFSFVEKRNDSNLSLEFILSVLNSRLMNFYFSNLYIDYNIKPKYIEKLPLVIPGENENRKINELVDNIIEIKEKLKIKKESFLLLLSTKYGNEIQNSKIKQWYRLDAGDFIKELRNVNVQLSLEEESQLLNYFIDEKNDLQIYETDISKIDDKINQHIYILYGLTESEIKIVEELSD